MKSVGESNKKKKEHMHCDEIIIKEQIIIWRFKHFKISVANCNLSVVGSKAISFELFYEVTGFLYVDKQYKIADKRKFIRRVQTRMRIYFSHFSLSFKGEDSVLWVRSSTDQIKFKVNSKTPDRFLRSFFMAIFNNSRRVEICWEEIVKEIFSYFRFDIWPRIWTPSLRLISQHT